MGKLLKSRGPELLMDLTIHTEDVLRSSAGLQEEDAQRVARQLIDRMRHHWGGQLVYFPKGNALDVSDRDMRLWEDFTGDNHQFLAEKYDLALQVVYKRIRIIREQLRKENEPDLFD